jgi:hypothetical protein
MENWVGRKNNKIHEKDSNVRGKNPSSPKYPKICTVKDKLQ